MFLKRFLWHFSTHKKAEKVPNSLKKNLHNLNSWCPPPLRCLPLGTPWFWYFFKHFSKWRLLYFQISKRSYFWKTLYVCSVSPNGCFAISHKKKWSNLNVNFLFSGLPIIFKTGLKDEMLCGICCLIQQHLGNLVYYF